MKLGDLERNGDQIDNSQKHLVNYDAYWDSTLSNTVIGRLYCSAILYLIVNKALI